MTYDMRFRRPGVSAEDIEDPETQRLVALAKLESESGGQYPIGLAEADGGFSGGESAPMEMVHNFEEARQEPVNHSETASTERIGDPELDAAREMDAKNRAYRALELGVRQFTEALRAGPGTPREISSSQLAMQPSSFAAELERRRGSEASRAETRARTEAYAQSIRQQGEDKKEAADIRRIQTELERERLGLEREKLGSGIALAREREVAAEGERKRKAAESKRVETEKKETEARGAEVPFGSFGVFRPKRGYPNPDKTVHAELVKTTSNAARIVDALDELEPVLEALIRNPTDRKTKALLESKQAKILPVINVAFGQGAMAASEEERGKRALGNAFSGGFWRDTIANIFTSSDEKARQEASGLVAALKDTRAFFRESPEHLAKSANMFLDASPDTSGATPSKDTDWTKMRKPDGTVVEIPTEEVDAALRGNWTRAD